MNFTLLSYFDCIFFHCMQDGGPLPSSLMTQMQSSAGGGKGVKGPQDLNYTTCRYYLDTESALRDTLMSSRLQGFRYTFFTHVPCSPSPEILSSVLCICAVLSAIFEAFASSSGQCLVFLPDMQPPVPGLPSMPSIVDASCYLLPIVNAGTCASERDACR